VSGKQVFSRHPLGLPCATDKTMHRMCDKHCRITMLSGNKAHACFPNTPLSRSLTSHLEAFCYVEAIVCPPHGHAWPPRAETMPVSSALAVPDRSAAVPNVIAR